MSEQQTAPAAKAASWRDEPVTWGEVANFAAAVLLMQPILFAIQLAWRLWHG